MKQIQTALSEPQRNAKGTAEAVAILAGLQTKTKDQTAAAFVLPRLPGVTQDPSKPVRWYQLTIQNETSSSFRLATVPKIPKHGRLAAVIPSVPPGVTWVVATATFKSTGQNACDDMLEFPLAFSDADGRAFTVRVHCHDHSPLRSDAISASQALQVDGELEEIPRLIARPPMAFEDSLGIYSTPQKIEENRLGSLKNGDYALFGPRKGRWAQLTAPVQGWVLFESREGVPFFVNEEPGSMHIRQTITLKTLSGGKPIARTEYKEPPVKPKVTSITEQDRLAEMKAHVARQQVQQAMGKRNAELEGQKLLGARKRQQWMGVL